MNRWEFMLSVLVAATIAIGATVLSTAVWPGDAPAGRVVAKGDLGRPDPSPELMRALMAWASPRLDLAVPAVMPRIVRKSHCELQAIAAPGGDCPADGSGVLALYDSGVMWLRDDWRGDNVRDLSTLLHEIIHHMQFHAGVEPVPCQAEAIERPAYEAQFAFLEAAGVDPYEAIGINDLMLIFVTHCLGR